jgi:hypothetical protein
MANPDDLVWIDVVEDDFWWTNYITGVKTIAADGTEAAFGIDSQYGMTDTGTSCIYVPTNFYDAFMNMIFDN